MTGAFLGARRRHRCAAGLTAAFILCGGAWAQQVPDAAKPIGFNWGPVALAPSLTMGYGHDSNLFLQSEHPLDPTLQAPPQADGVLTVQPAFILTVPFSNSAFHLGDTLRYTDYAKTPQELKNANEIFADTSLWFGSLDMLKLLARYTSGVAETIKFDPGGAIQSLNGQPFRLDTEEFSIGREIYGARGYRFSVTRNKLACDDIPILNYQGFDAEAAYLQPLSSNTRLAFSYLGSRYDRVCTTSNGDVPCRESGHSIYGAVEGNLGPRQPYRIRLGWERLGSGLSEVKGFSGAVGEANLSAIVGSATTFLFALQRQPYRVLVDGNNFYLINQASTTVEHRFGQVATIGAVGSFTESVYPNPTSYDVILDPGNPDQDPPVPPTVSTYHVYRRDHTVALEAYANLPIVERCAFRFSIRKNQRGSSFPGADYSGTVVSGGLVVGWF